ncbi:MAG: TMEM165/GDT1 family protein [Pseudomonadales bacterium]|nr:TMEM165/GDT1 family protein [Pseudomonadales bacterium]
MEPRLLLTVFLTVFLAEIGDKTQLATLLFAAREPGAWLGIFLAATIALACATAIGVAAGAALGQWLDPRLLGVLAGVGFVAIGIWTLVGALRA